MFHCLESLVLAAAFAGPLQSEDPLASQLNAVLARPEYRNARWGLLVIDATTGQTVFALNADQLFAPASVTKLFSCGAAMVGFGPDHRFETPVYTRGKRYGDKFAGDLILVASGDLTMGGRTDKKGKMSFADSDHIYASVTGLTTGLADADPLAGLDELARQVKKAGISRIDGDVLIDDRLFDRAKGSGSGPDIVTPILINDNIVDVVVTPGAKAGDVATHELRPKTDFVRVDLQVETVAKGKGTSIRVERVGPQRYSVRGRITVGEKPQVRICVVDDPVGFARALFIDALRRQGVEVAASGLRAPTAELPERDSYAKLTRVALLRSLPLSEALTVTLKVSHNPYASTLPLLLAAKNGERTLSAGMRRQGKILADLGVDVDTISLESGAGGGNGDRVTPRAVVQLLQGLRKRPDWPTFEAMLPVLGVDGTLLTAVDRESQAKGKVKGKTGTYTDANLLQGKSHLRAKSLAGIMTTAKGKTLLYAIIVNDVPLAKGVTATREGRVIGRLCEILYQHGP